MIKPVGRDFAIDMAKAIQDVIPTEGEYKAYEIAEALIAKLDNEDPDLLLGYLQAQAVTFVAAQITARRSHLARTAQRQTPTKFQSALAAYEKGDSEPLSIFTQTIAVNSDNIVRQIGKLTKDDCAWISDHRTKVAKSMAFEASFYSALAAKIPAGKLLEDVMDEVQFLTLRESLTKL